MAIPFSLKDLNLTLWRHPIVHYSRPKGLMVDSVQGSSIHSYAILWLGLLLLVTEGSQKETCPLCPQEILFIHHSVTWDFCSQCREERLYPQAHAIAWKVSAQSTINVWSFWVGGCNLYHIAPHFDCLYRINMFCLASVGTTCLCLFCKGCTCCSAYKWHLNPAVLSWNSRQQISH